MPRSGTYTHGFKKEHTGPCRPGASTYPNRTVGSGHSRLPPLKIRSCNRRPSRNAIYEEDFLGFSYGFRPKRGQHDALDALVVGITTKKVNFIFDADIRSYFDSVNHAWLICFLQHPRICAGGA